MRRLDCRSWTGSGRAGRQGCRNRSARGDCRSCRKLHRKIFAAASAGKTMKAFSDYRALVFAALFVLIWQSSGAEVSPEVAEAAAPLAEGVPEVAVVRLQTLLGRNLPDEGWRRAVAEKLAEALVAAKQPADALN